MKPDVFSEALRATARIACCATLLGCGPKNTAPPPVAATAGDQQDGACEPRLLAFLETSDNDEKLAEKAGDDMVSCCVQIIAGTELGDDRGEFGACCAIADSMDGMCYPWGPPRPPEQAASAVESHRRAMAVRLAARGAEIGHMLDLRARSREAAPHLNVSPEQLRRMAVTTWKGRMINEYQSHGVFLVLAERLAEVGVSAVDVARCREFAAEERNHGVLCGAVVEALGGQASAYTPDTAPMPRHAGVDPLEAVLRDLLSICCLSETVAVALIGAERLEMPAGPLRDLLTRIYADECGHANFGWRLLPTLLPDDAAMKQRLGDYLATALAHLEAHELAHIPDREAPAGGEMLGLCSGVDSRRLFYATVEQVILPGLRSHGLHAVV